MRHGNFVKLELRSRLWMSCWLALALSTSTSQALAVWEAWSPQSSNGGVRYAVWVRMVARHVGSLLDCQLTTRWDHDISLNSFDDRLVCKLGEEEYSQADVLNQRIEESLRFHRGDIVEGVILATGIRPIPRAFRQGMLMPFELTLEDEFENQTIVTGDLSVDRTARSTELPARCGTGLYGDSAASRRARESLRPTQQHAFSSHLHRREDAQQHNARPANDAEM